MTTFSDEHLIHILRTEPGALAAALDRAKMRLVKAGQTNGAARHFIGYAMEEQHIADRNRPPRPIGFGPSPEESAAIERFQIGRLRVAMEIDAAFGWLDGLGNDVAWRIENTPQGQGRVDLVRSIGMQSPIIATWIESQDERGRIAEQANARAAEARQAAFDAGAPQRCLEAIEGVGGVLTVKGKDVLATNAAAVTPSMIEALKEHKAGVVAILTARTSASAPIVLA